MACRIDIRVHSYTSTTKEDALATICALGESWWKQLIDGKFHHLGPKVFDEGLHSSGIAEPGFYESAFKAYQFIQEHLCEPMSVQLYQEIHKIACAHFRGDENNTLCTAKDTGCFRTSIPSCAFPKINFIRLLTNEFTHEKLLRFVSGLDKQDTIPSEEDEKIFDFYFLNLKKFENKISKFSCYINDHCDALEYCLENDEITMTVEMLFDKFNRKISEAQASIKDPHKLKERKIELIARLYQQLEWTHPFADGQGRTDLLLLAKLLSEHGLTPAILEDPYVSTITFTSHWVDYLKRGMLLWEQEQSMIHSGELKHG